MTRATTPAIPDIHIGRVYDRRDPECEIHYETFGRLADFFGRNTPAHRHYCFYQLHVLERGAINLNLDGQVYSGRGPLLIFTPPTIPHAFYSEEETDGHVLTIRQEVVRTWFRAMPGQWPDSLLREGVFLELARLPAECQQDFEALAQLLNLLQVEAGRAGQGHSALLLALGQGAFIHLCRLLVAGQPLAGLRPERSEDLRLFMQFCDLVEAHFHEHLTLSGYAGRLSVTEARLNDICRRVASRPSKEIVHERLLQEACRMLRFSAMPVSEISYQLGFADPAYFSRFFAKRIGMPPSQYRSGNASASA